MNAHFDKALADMRTGLAASVARGQQSPAERLTFALFDVLLALRDRLQSDTNAAYAAVARDARDKTRVAFYDAGRAVFVGRQYRSVNNLVEEMGHYTYQRTIAPEILLEIYNECLSRALNDWVIGASQGGDWKRQILKLQDSINEIAMAEVKECLRALLAIVAEHQAGGAPPEP